MRFIVGNVLSLVLIGAVTAAFAVLTVHLAHRPRTASVQEPCDVRTAEPRIRPEASPKEVELFVKVPPRKVLVLEAPPERMEYVTPEEYGERVPVASKAIPELPPPEFRKMARVP